MNDFLEQKEKAKEMMLEAILEYAGACHAENIVEEMQGEKNEYMPLFPSELDKRIKRIINQHNRKENLKELRRTSVRLLQKVAVIFLVASISFSVLLLGVEAFRVKVINLIMETTKEYTEIKSESPIEDAEKERLLEQKDLKEMYLPDYIPEGFKILKTELFSASKIIHYSNDKDQLIVFAQYNNENASIRIDTEEAKVEKIVINGSEGLLVEKEQLITILWHNDNSSFYLKSKTDKDLLIKMAESINYKK